MALIAVLWGIALLSIVAALFLSSGSISYRIARNSTEISQVDALAEAAIARAALSLLDSRPDKRWRVDGVAQSFTFGGEAVRILIQDELGRIDLNHADWALFGSLFQSAGLGVEAANRLTDKVLDWTESSSFKRLNGAKAQDYRAAGNVYLPRNGAFQSVDELKLVMDLSPELFRRVEPAFTVFSGSQFFDPSVAPREALLALPTMDPAKVTSIIAARTGNAGSSTIPESVTMPSISLAGRALTIRAEIRKSNAVLVREAVIRITDDTSKPFWLLSWKAK